MLERKCKTLLSFVLHANLSDSEYVLGQSARAKQLEIAFNGNLYGTLQVLQAFELIPFIVLDNAGKYSPPNLTIDVDFIETTQEVSATVRSLGPALISSEQDRLFEQHFRGKHTRCLAVYGAGLGLYVARNIAELHEGVSISAKGDSVSKCTINNVPYAEFRVTISAKR
ncbi:MAG: sensor histidine kinase [Chitinispirillaceae bacterium]|nr:sensor histidine kinase [Chitinispirillaceae bacterium]